MRKRGRKTHGSPFQCFAIKLTPVWLESFHGHTRSCTVSSIPHRPGSAPLNLLQWKDPGTSNMSWQIFLVVINESGGCIDGRPFGQTGLNARKVHA